MYLYRFEARKLLTVISGMSSLVKSIQGKAEIPRA